nr:hypothetical protein CFP56_37397 [Quercus suber]
MGGVKDNTQSEAVFMEAEPSGVLVSHYDNLHRIDSSDIGGISKVLNKSMESLVGQGQLTYTLPMQNVLCNKGEVGHSEGLNGIFSFGVTQTPLADITNRVATQPLKSSKKKWTKLMREVGESDSSSDMETSESRRPELETVDLTIRKKKRVSAVTRLLRDFLEANDDAPVIVRNPVQPKWSALALPLYKANFDGALFKSTNSTGLGVIIRDTNVAVMGALSARVPLLQSVAMVEALACRRAVQFAVEIRLHEVIFEGDAVVVIKAI